MYVYIHIYVSTRIHISLSSTSQEFSARQPAAAGPPGRL